MIKSTQEYLNCRQAGEYLGLGYSTVLRDWPKWVSWGIVPSRYPSRTLRFKRSDLDRLMQANKVQQEGV